MTNQPGIAVRSTRLLKERKDSYIIIDTDETGTSKIRTIPKTEFSRIKYGLFNGGRIYYKFEEGTDVQETYDEGIFNCNFKGMFIQLRDKMGIIRAIQEHRDKGTFQLYEEMFTTSFKREHTWDLLKYMLAAYRKRVRIVPDITNLVVKWGANINNCKTDGVIIVDDLWTVDSHGTVSCEEVTVKQPSEDLFTLVDVPKLMTYICRVCGKRIEYSDQQTHCYKIKSGLRSSQLPFYVNQSSSTSRYIHREHLDEKIVVQKRVCLVVKGDMESEVINTPVGDMIMDDSAQEIMSKVIFLLVPNMEDKIFTQQIPMPVMDKLQEVLARADATLKAPEQWQVSGTEESPPQPLPEVDENGEPLDFDDEDDEENEDDSEEETE